MDASSSLRVEKTKLKSVIKKTFVLDTNVLLHDPTAIAAFNEHAVVIPMTVLEELDHIKDRPEKTVSREARIAINIIDKIVEAASPQEIQELPLLSRRHRSSRVLGAHCSRFVLDLLRRSPSQCIRCGCDLQN